MKRKSVKPLYDTKRSFDYNLKHGPFGGFADGTKFETTGEPRYDFFGIKVHTPFGIAAGPLPGHKFIRSVFDKGFDIATFKSVRTDNYPVHPMPNVVPLKIEHLNPANTDEAIFLAEKFDQPLSIANSFGVPSFHPEVWQPRIKEAFEHVGPGQAMMTALQGTDRGHGHKKFVDDHVRGVKLLKDAGAKVIEVNLSCPNEGSKELLCFDTKTTVEIVKRIRESVKGVKLLVKITYFEDKAQLEDFIKQVGPYIHGISAINTIAAKTTKHDGSQALVGGPERLKPGVSGYAIKNAALEMTGHLANHRKHYKHNFKIVGMGGVMDAQDFQNQLDAGADIVMSVTGAMWNPDLGLEIKRHLKIPYRQVA